MYLMLGLYILTSIKKKTVTNLSKKEYAYLLAVLFITTCFINTMSDITMSNLNLLIKPYQVLSLIHYFSFIYLGII